MDVDITAPYMSKVAKAGTRQDTEMSQNQSLLN